MDIRICLHELVDTAMTSLVNSGYKGSPTVTAELPLNPDDSIIICISMDSGERTTADRVSGHQQGCQQPAAPD
jgi:hypothetical protein